tara:strand:+ start:1061 stop:1879 length:819 start_codon:yes stop_codon:yes gene_type:complete
MSYKYSKGSQVIGDLKAADDTQRDTLIDFGEDYIGLETSGSVRMVISGSDGKVGIGSTSPSHKLDVNGDIRIRGNDIRDNSGNPAITFDGSTNTSFAGSVTSATLGFTGSLNGTASVALKDQIGETLIGGVFEIDQGIFQNPHSSYNPIYFPSDDSFTERVGPSSINYFVAPFNGELIKVQLRSTGSFIGKQLTVSLHVGVDGNNAYSSTAATSLVLNGQAANTTYNFDFTSAANTTFSAGNIYGFSLGIGGGFDGDETFRFTTVVKFNPYA